MIRHTYRRLRRWINRSLRSQSLQSRMVMLTATAVATSVAVVGIAAYLITRWSLYDQLDRELVQLSGYTSNVIASDIDNMGGLNTDSLRAVNASLVVVSASGQQLKVPGLQAGLQPDSTELAIARLQAGYTARTAVGTDGVSYRMVTTPMSVGSTNYAVVLGRSVAPTVNTLDSLWLVMLAVGLMGTGFAVTTSYWVGRAALSPVRELSDAVHRITNTDELDPIQILSDDELGDLTRSFNAMLASLGQSRERQRRLIADAGHELRTPLTSMRTNIELLVADEHSGMLPPGARNEILHDVAAQLGEFTSLVADLVQLSREDKLQRNPVEIDFADVVSASIDRAKRRGPSINFDVVLNPLIVMGEADTLERAVTNLLDNAVKFSPPDGTIHVHLIGDRLRIADEGPGIAEEDLPHVFDRFYRSDRARNTPGTGLGLSIVAHTVNSHGGWVRAGRAAEGGAEFVLHLPSSLEQPASSD